MKEREDRGEAIECRSEKKSNCRRAWKHHHHLCENKTSSRSAGIEIMDMGNMETNGYHNHNCDDMGQSDSLFGKRKRDNNDVGDEDDDDGIVTYYEYVNAQLVQRVEARKMMDNFETENIHSYIGLLYLDKYFKLHLGDSPSVDVKRGRAKWGDNASEVFRVTINMVEEKEAYLSGRIYYSNYEDIVYIYKRDGEQKQQIKGNCDLMTSGSGALLFSGDHINIVVDLYLTTSVDQVLPDTKYFLLDWLLRNDQHKTDGKFYFKDGKWVPGVLEGHDTIMDEIEIDEEPEQNDSNVTRITNCKGCFTKQGMFVSWNFCNSGMFIAPTRKKDFFDKAARYKVGSSDGAYFVTVYYAYFQDAVLATVEVIWLKAKEPEYRVYGLIAARNTMINEPDYEMILFQKKRDESVALTSNQPIQLSKCVVAVPIKSDLLLRVHLKISDDFFLSARLRFPAQQNGTISEIPINDVMNVKVRWSCCVV